MNYLNQEKEIDRRLFEIPVAMFVMGIILNLCFALPTLCNCKQRVSIQLAKLNPNVATVYELAELPLIGSKKAEAIINHREKTTFRKADDLGDVKGIGEKTVEKIREWLVFDGVNLSEVK